MQEGGGKNSKQGRCWKTPARNNLKGWHWRGYRSRLQMPSLYCQGIWELDHKEGWAPKNWCFWTVVLEKTLESPWDSKEIKPVNPEGNWPLDVKSHLIGKDSDAGRDWRQKERWAAEDETVDSVDMNLNKFQETAEDRGAWHAVVHGFTESDKT